MDLGGTCLGCPCQQDNRKLSAMAAGLPQINKKYWMNKWYVYNGKNTT